MAVVMVKTCRGCGEEKPLSEFNRDRRSLDGKRTRCRECERKASWRKQRKHRVIDNEKNNARHALHRAIKAGTITPPEACAHCGAVGPVEGHHNDYSRPLEVTWLCRQCHQFMETLERENHNLRLKLAQTERERDEVQAAVDEGYEWKGEAGLLEAQRDELVEALRWITEDASSLDRTREVARAALAKVHSDDEIPPGMEGVMQPGC